MEASNLRFKKKKGEEKGRKRKEKERKKEIPAQLIVIELILITTGDNTIQSRQFTFSRTGHKTKQHYKNSILCEWHLCHCISAITKANSQGGTGIFEDKGLHTL